MSLAETLPRPDRLQSSATASPAPIRPASTIRAVGCLVVDTFRQAASNRLMLLAACLAALGVVACLSVRVDGPRHLKPEGRSNCPTPGESP